MRQKIILVLLVMVISFFFLFSSAYSYYNSLIEADFLTCGLKFETADTDDLLVDKQIIVDFALGLISTVGSLGADLFERPTPSSFQVPGIDPSLSILRC
ncbi:MAG: hypothetical protein ABSB32_03520 [Thermodesulfobacteriota bacterium]|jgi:hypothetical protein